MDVQGSQLPPIQTIFIEQLAEAVAENLPGESRIFDGTPQRLHAQHRAAEQILPRLGDLDGGFAEVHDAIPFLGSPGTAARGIFGMEEQSFHGRLSA